MKREDYKKKIALCDKLGASKFQKIVLKVEEIKFKVLKQLFPNFIEHYDRYIDKKRDKKLKRETDVTKREQIIKEYRNNKIALRRELNKEQNRNYHMNENKPTEFIFYLNWNKKVHEKGLIRNIIAIVSATCMNLLGIAPALTVMVIVGELLGAFINFQCINIQNSHIYRFKMLEEVLKRKEERKNSSNIENYTQAANVYSRTLETTMEVPTLEQLISNIKTKEEAEELRKMIAAVRKNNSKIKKQKEQLGSASSKSTPDEKIYRK